MYNEKKDKARAFARQLGWATVTMIEHAKGISKGTIEYARSDNPRIGKDWNEIEILIV